MNSTFGYDQTGFYVISNDSTRQIRVDSVTLHRNLLWSPDKPFLNKNGTPAKRKHKDPTLPYYYAQLLHYGLKPLKSKAAAKKLLLTTIEASANKRLVIPEALVKMEATMKEEWDEKQESEKRKREDHLEEMRKRRKQELQDSGPDDGWPHIPPTAAYSPGFSTNGYLDIKLTSSDVLAAVKNGSISDAKLRAVVCKILESSDSDSLYDLKFSLAKEIAGNEQADKIAGKASTAKNYGKPLASGWIGSFELLSPKLSDSYSDSADDGLSITLAPSNGKSHVWGTFQLGILEGVLRSTSAPPTTIGSSLNFTWRGRSTGEGEIEGGGEDDNGYIVFLGDGKINGYIATTFGQWEFDGTKVLAQPKKDSAKLVRSWKAEWRGLTAEAHGREGAARWGGWCESARPESPAASDTTNGGGRSDESAEESESGYGGHMNVAF